MDKESKRTGFFKKWQNFIANDDVDSRIMIIEQDQ